MSLFPSVTEVRKFQAKLVRHALFNNEEMLLGILLNTKIRFEWHSPNYQNANYGVYKMILSVPINVYTEYEERIKSVAFNIRDIANQIMVGKDQISLVQIFQENHDVQYQDLLIIIEKLKSILILRATGHHPDEQEYKNYKKILNNHTEISLLIPLFLKSSSNLSEFFAYIQPKFPTYTGRRNHIQKSFAPLLEFLENQSKSPIKTQAINSLSKLSLESVHELWSKALERSKADPEGAITVANSFIEATIKSLLNELVIDYKDESNNISKLYQLLSKKLNLAPAQHVEEIFKQTLGGCCSIIIGIGSLRNKISDAHAAGKMIGKPAQRHAELVVNLAGSMACFLIETWEKGSIK